MEVWALYAYGASNVLQEILTIKSDDTAGRVKAYEAIVKGDNIDDAEVPESFKVLMKEMKSLGLNVEMVAQDQHTINFDAADMETRGHVNAVQSMMEADAAKTEAEEGDALKDIAADLRSLMDDDLLGGADADVESLIGTQSATDTETGEGEER